MRLLTLALFLWTLSPLLASETRAEKLSDGYALLFDLSSDEKNADGVFLFKTATPETKETVKRLADLFRRVNHQLKAWSDADSTIDLDVTHLPALEVETRKGIASQHAHEVFATKTPAFDKLFLTLQWQSIYYALNMVKALEKQETSTERRHVLAQWVVEFEQLRVEVSEMLTLSTFNE
jgi:hypothetical protein